MGRMDAVRSALLCSAAVFGLGVGLASDEVKPDWKAGASAVVITPKESIWLAGYADRKKPSQGVLQDLKAKALALQDQNGLTAVIVTSDLAGFQRAVAEAIADRAREKYGLPRDRLLLNSSHTHSGPLTALDLFPAGYDVPEEQKPVITNYTRWMIDQVVEAIGKAIQNLQPAHLSYEQGLAGFAVNRRRERLRHLPGPVDHDVPVLTARDASGETKAILFGYACHNTVLSGYQISGDYAGFAQEALEKAVPGAVALFVAGCGADANPLPRRTVPLARRYGETLATAVTQVLEGKMRPLTGALRTAFERVDLPIRKTPARDELQAELDHNNQARARRARQLLGVLDREGSLPDRYPSPVQVWQFGRGLVLIALGGEVVVDYSLRLKGLYGWHNTWVAAYSNDVFAYVPSLRVLQEGGYEGGAGPNIPYGLPAPFAAAVEEILVEKVEELVAKTRPKP